MISINDLHIQFADKYLFRDVSVRINGHERIGLIGVNGAGKSTLLKIMAGLVETDDGVVQRAKRMTVGYLPQEIDAIPPGRSLYEEAKTAFADTLSLKAELDRVNAQLANIAPDSPEIDELLRQQGELQHRLEQADIFTMQARIEKVLLGLGFRQADFARDCHSFSGGWLMRLMLAKLLLAEPSLLLLDEPTNHLDLDSLTWLESFLAAYPGAMVIISHDRAFLDALTDTTWELSLGRLTVYKGNYSRYLTEKESRMEVLRAAYDNQQAQIQQTMRFVERFRAKSTKAKQVQSRLRQLEKMERIELDSEERSIAFRFPPAAPSGREVLHVEGLAKRYQEAPVFEGLSFDLQRGDKLAIIGVNGAGKSTLVKILAGLVKADRGTVRQGHNVTLSYFGQHQAQELAPGLTVLETLSQVAGEMSTTQIRSLLGAFLFRGDAVDKQVAVLSGGEKSRLALTKMIATPANLLVMDEPTNHLDMTSQEVLQEALGQYDGTIVIVSHNRYFLDSFINKVLEIKEGRATLYEGTIADHLVRQAAAREASAASPPERPPAAAPVAEAAAGRPRGKEARQREARLRQQKSERLGPVKKRLTKLEADIEALEARKAELERLLADPELYRDQEAFADRSKEYAALERRLDRLFQEWERLEAEAETIEAEFADTV